jgi:hypothetical protein
MGNRKVCFHPLFRVALVQKCRHNEYELAIEMAAAELKEAAVESGSGSGSGDGDNSGASSGVVMVPTPQRAYELGYSKKPETRLQESGYEWR